MTYGYEINDLAKEESWRMFRIIGELVEGFDRLSESTGLHPTSRELLIKAATEEPESDPILLFDKVDFQGNWIILSGPWWNLGSWLDFDNKASSMLVVLGIGVLYEDTWWRGDSCWFFGVPYYEEPDLSSVGFDNMASSALLL